MAAISDVLSTSEQDQVVKTIARIETATAAEIRVHLERKCVGGDALQRARQLFGKLQMHKTVHKNGVLLYIAYQDRKCAVFGGRAVHDELGDEYWNGIVAEMVTAFSGQQFARGINTALDKIGRTLGEHFPSQNSNEDELPNTLSWGD